MARLKGTTVDAKDFVAPYAHPNGRAFGRLASWLANNRWLRKLRRTVFAHLPFPVLQSDVRDVVYLNWVVPTRRVAHLVPPGVRLAQWEDATILTVLVYRHGHFGPRGLGMLRRRFPSPLQCNCRLYVGEIHGMPVERPTVHFIRNFFDSAVYAIGTRVGSDALPSELSSDFNLSVGPGVHARIVDAGDQLVFDCTAEASTRERVEDAFGRLFPGWNDAIATLALQDAATAQPPDIDRLALAGISLPIDIANVRPLRVTQFEAGAWLAELGASGMPFAFVVPQVRFQVLWERLLETKGKDVKGRLS